MKTTPPIPLFVVGLFMTAPRIFGQGPLTPPGAPAPTMKALDQIEPRTPITSIPVTIAAPGSSYLAGNLTGVAGSNGITINADDVTLDLNGFSLIGVASSLNGILVSGIRANTRIYNGVLRN
jgi:hypothetical protein